LQISITDKARQTLQDLLEKSDKTHVRILLKNHGWGEPQLSLTLDEPTEKDTVQEENSIPFLIDKTLLEKIAKVNIDYRRTWMGQGLVVNGKSKFPGIRNSCCH